MPQFILVIDDEASIRRFLQMALETAGFEVRLASDGQQGLDAFTLRLPDLVLLDLGLPDISGLDVLRRLREWAAVPVIVLSVRDQEKQKVEALDLGADDYLTKPFGIQELLARMRVAMRNSAGRSAPQSTVFRLGNLSVDRATYQVSKQDKAVKLTKTEYKLFNLLMQHAGKVLTHRQILAQIWGDAYLGETHYLQVYISQLRRKLEDDPTQPRFILTEPGVGYRLADEA